MRIKGFLCCSFPLILRALWCRRVRSVQKTALMHWKPGSAEALAELTDKFSGPLMLTEHRRDSPRPEENSALLIFKKHKWNPPAPLAGKWNAENPTCHLWKADKGSADNRPGSTAGSTPICYCQLQVPLLSLSPGLITGLTDRTSHL